MLKESLLKQINECEKEMEDWKNKNNVLWKNAFNKKKELLFKLEAVKKEKKEVEKVTKVIKKKSNYKVKKPFDSADVNKDGNVDFKDIVDVAKKIVRRK